MILLWKQRILGHAAVAAALLLLLAGCAGENQFREGLNLIDQGQYEQGLAKLEEASKANPSDPRYRMALLSNKGLAAERLNEMAQAAESQGRFKEADALYRRVLGVDPGNPRATEALRNLQNVDAQNAVLQQAQAAYAKKDYEEAASLTAGILRTNPRHKGAAALMAEIEKARVKDNLSLPQLKSRFTKPVTLEFRDANVKMVFDVLSRTSGINFIFDKDVRGETKVTIYVRNVAVEDAIDLLLIQSQLEKKVLSDNSVLVFPGTPQKLKEYQDLVIRSFYLGNGDAKQTLNLIKTIIKTKDVYVDDRLNLVVMRDTPEAVRLAEKLINAQDMAEPEVLLEMEVLEINLTKTYEMGITWPNTFTVLPSEQPLTLADLPFGDNGSLSNNDVAINTNLIAKLRQDNNITNIISNPRVRVRNREKARVLIGNREPVVTSTVTPGSTNPIVTENVQYLDVGVKLEVEPTVLLDDEVSMKVSLEVSAKGQTVVTSQGNQFFAVNTRNVNTVLRLKDGQTAVMMGFIRDDSQDTATGIPGLTDIPVISRLFSSGTTGYQKNEIVFSITPRVVRNLKRLEANSTEFWSGTETALRTKPPILQSAQGAPQATATALAPVIPPQPGITPAAAANSAAAPPPGAAPDGGTPAVAPPPAAGESAAQTAAAPSTAAPGPAQPVKISWAAPAAAKVGDEIKVSVLASSPDPLMSAGAVLGFNPAQLQVVKVEEGTLLKQGGGETDFTQNSRPGVGRVVANVKRKTEPGVQGEGPLFTVTFKVVGGADKAQILLLSVSPVGNGGAGMRFQAIGPHTITVSK